MSSEEDRDAEVAGRLLPLDHILNAVEAALPYSAEDDELLTKHMAERTKDLEMRRIARWNPSPEDGFIQSQHKGVCKSCHHVMWEADGEFFHKAVDKEGKPYRCEYVRQGRLHFKFGAPEVEPFLSKKDRRSNKRAEKF